MPSIAVSVPVISSVDDVPWEVIAYGRRIAPTIRAADLYPDAEPSTKVLFRGEGINSSVVIADRADCGSFMSAAKRKRQALRPTCVWNG